MEVGGRAIRKTEAVTNSSNPFQTKRCLAVVMGEQDMVVLMPHGNWSWGPFSQLANQLTGCRRKTTARTLPGFPIPTCKPPRDFLMGEFLGNPAHLRQLTKLLVWPVEWSPLPLPWQSSVRAELGQRGGHTRLSWPEPLPSIFCEKPFMEKPSANQSGGTAQNLDWVNLQQTKIPKCVLSSAFIAESYITRKNFFLPISS